MLFVKGFNIDRMVSCDFN